MRKYLGVALALILLTGTFTFAQFGGLGYGGVQFIVAVSDQVQNDENPLILFKYLGVEEQATIDITGNVLRFYDGDQGAVAIPDSTATDVNVGDVCGTANGDLDITDAECDTFGRSVCF